MTVVNTKVTRVAEGSLDGPNADLLALLLVRGRVEGFLSRWQVNLASILVNRSGKLTSSILSQVN